MLLDGLRWNYVEVVSNGSIYRTQKGKLGFAFYYKLGGEKKRKSVTGDTEDELKDKAVKFLNELDREYCEELSRPLTFRKVGEQWFEEYKGRRNAKKGKISYASVESRECSLKAINKVIGDELIEDIDDKVAESLIDKCSEKADGTYYSRSHVDKLQQVFHLVMEYGKKHGYCTQCPDKITLSDNLTEVDKDSRFLDEEKIQKIFKAVEENIRYKTVIHFLLATGLRQEEAFALNINDFHKLQTGNYEIDICKTVVETEGHVYQIVNELKTKRSRRKIFIPPEVYELIKEYYDYVIENETELQSYMREMYNMEGYIFLNKDMKPYNKRTFQNNFKKYLKRRTGSDMDFKATLHMFRHSFVSFQADDIPLDKVAMIIGDSVATTANMYQSLTNRAKNEVCRSTTGFYNRLKRGTGE